ncbi:hypothetical protein LSL4_gp9c [Pseudomonas phage LSL4]|nr:hypothetical protein LSL4_gp9c [Pseudomonas phage LSL4]
MKTMIMVEKLNNGLTVYRPKVKMYQPLLDRLLSWHPNKWRDCHLIWPNTVRKAEVWVMDPTDPDVHIPEGHLEKAIIAQQEIYEGAVALKSRCQNIEDLTGMDLSKSFAELVLDMCIDSYNSINGVQVKNRYVLEYPEKKRGYSL